MKNRYKILKGLLFFIIYCFGIVVFTNTLSSKSVQSVEQNNVQKDYFANVSKVVFFNIDDSESLLSSLNEYASPNFKLPFKGFYLVTYTGELYFKSKFKQYKNNLNKILIRYRKSDLIFPFHNFW